MQDVDARQRSVRNQYRAYFDPLAAILAQTQLLLLDAESGDGLHGPLKDIEMAALRCRKIVQDLLNFSRQKPTDRRSRHSLRQIIERVGVVLSVVIRP